MKKRIIHGNREAKGTRKALTQAEEEWQAVRQEQMKVRQLKEKEEKEKQQP